jgi:hypothetical protein
MQPWVAYRVLMMGQLLALHKRPGIGPIGVGKTLRRGLAKCVLLVAGNEANEACSIDKLFAGLEGSIQGGIHVIQHVWEGHYMEEEWGFLIIDASRMGLSCCGLYVMSGHPELVSPSIATVTGAFW